MDIQQKVIDLLKSRKEDEFNLGENLIIDGIDLGKMRSMIGYRSKDLAEDVKVSKMYLGGFKSYVCGNSGDRVLFYLHGGCFYGGSAVVYENICKYLAKYANIRVINMEYPLAPISKFPDTSRLIYSAIKEYVKKYTPQYIYVAGDSAGGHLALNVAQEDAIGKRLISKLFLYYPCMSLSKLENWDISMYNLDKDSKYAKKSIESMCEIFPYIEKFYAPDRKYMQKKEYNMNLMDKTDFEKLPDIVIFQAQFDYFNLEIDRFKEKFNVKSHTYMGMPHGFMEFLGYLPEVKDALDQTIKYMDI